MVSSSEVSVSSIAAQILYSDDRRRIQPNDLRCSWIFKSADAKLSPRPQNLESLVLSLVENDDGSVQSFLEHVCEYLDELEELAYETEIIDILNTQGLTAPEIGQVINYYGLTNQEQEIIPRPEEPSLPIRRLLLSAKGVWCPSVAKHVREYPELFMSEGLRFRAEEIYPSAPESRSNQLFSFEQAQRLKRFFGIRFSTSNVYQKRSKRGDEDQHVQLPGSMEDSKQEASIVASAEVDSSATPGVEKTEAKPLNGTERSAYKGPIESEDVRAKLLQIIRNQDMRLGVIEKSLVLEKAKQSGLLITAHHLDDMIDRLDGAANLDDEWIGRTATGAGEGRLIIEHVASKVLSVIDRIPVEILHAQLGRANPTYKKLSTEAVRIYYDAHPGFRIDGEYLLADSQRKLRRMAELEPIELALWSSVSSSVLTLSPAQISQIYSGRRKLTTSVRDRLLRESPLFVKFPDGFAALGSAPALHERIRKVTSFITRLDVELESTLEYEFEDDATDVVDHDQNLEPMELRSADLDKDIGPAIHTIVEDISEVNDGADTGTSSDSAEPTAIPVARSFGETRTEVLTIRELVRQVTSQEILLPEIQRGYVWKPAQVKDLFDSLYNGYPIGTLLVWESEQRLKGKRVGTTRYFDSAKQERTKFLLDGQQRSTSIAWALEGRGPKLYFNAMDENGGFRTTTASPAISLRSIPVAGLDRESLPSLMHKLKLSEDDPSFPFIRPKLEHLLGILDRHVSMETLHGFDYGEATDIFIRVNSRGTKLKNAELAIANLAYRLPGTVGGEIQRFSEELQAMGWDFPVPFLIRLITAVATRRVGFNGLNAADDETIIKSWLATKIATHNWIRTLRDNLGIHSEDTLVGKNNHIVPIVWMATHNETDVSHRMLYWWLLSGVFSRYTGRTDSNLDQDLRFIDNPEEKIVVEHLLTPLRARRSTLRIEPMELERAGAQSGLRVLLFLANLHIASSNLFSSTIDASPQKPPVATRIWSNAQLRNGGFDHGDRWAKDGGLVNTVFIDPDSDEKSVVDGIRNLKELQRYQHAMPLPPTFATDLQIQQFLGERSRRLVDQFNDVLNSLESGQFRIRSVEVPATGTKSTRQLIDHKQLPFDYSRRMMYETVRKFILEIDPNIQEFETAVYIGFSKSLNSRPFATIAKRKSVLNFTIDAEVEELGDSRGLLRDVTNVSKHGIGNASITISRMDEVTYVQNLIEQVMDLRM